MSTVQIDQISTGAAQWHRQSASLCTARADCPLRPPLGLHLSNEFAQNPDPIRSKAQKHHPVLIFILSGAPLQFEITELGTYLTPALDWLCILCPHSVRNLATC